VKSNKALETLNNLYDLLVEMNFHKEPSDFIDDLKEDNPFISKHLQNVLLHRTKAKAILKEKKFSALKKQFLKLKELGSEKLQQLYTPEEKAQLVPLFRKFEELDEKDISDINDDQDFLIFISSLKDKLEDGNDAE